MRPGLPLLWRSRKERYNLIGSKCENCGTYYMPKRMVCPKCRRKGRMNEYKFKGTGKIYSFTVIRVAPEDYEYYLPYTLAIVELDEGPRILGQIVDVDHSQVHIGQKVEMVFRKIHDDAPEGLITYGFKFKIVPE